MKLGTRLLLPLLVVVALVMAAFALWALRQRIDRVRVNSERETQAYAAAFELALEAELRDTASGSVQDAIDRISTEPTIFGVVVYGADGGVLHHTQAVPVMDPAAPEAVAAALAGNGTTLEREIEGEPVFAVLRPIRDRSGRVIGAFEVAQPLRSLVAELERTRNRFLLNTLTLLGAIAMVSLLLVRRLIARPIADLLEGVRAVGRGDLGYRLPADGGSGELAEVAYEFNRMADRLERARMQLLDETKERLELERRLRETEKMAAIGNLAAGLGHEIGAPLHVIRGRAEMLQRGDPGPDERRRHASIVIAQIDRIARIVRSLLDLSRRKPPRLESIDATAILRGVGDFLEPELNRQEIRLDWENETRLPIRGDPNLLHQVFLNVLVNSVQAVSVREDERIIRIRTQAQSNDAGEYGTIEVRDNGGGIREDALERMFEPFYTTKEPGAGTGLGLAVARSIVDEHGGRIEAANEEAGACIRIVLPLNGASHG